MSDNENNRSVSIIIPCHNSDATLKRCWNSIKNQSMDLGSMEIFFVDDASDDNNATWEMLLEIENEAPESVIILHLEENMRQGEARNAVLPYIHGKYSCSLMQMIRLMKMPAKNYIKKLKLQALTWSY